MLRGTRDVCNALVIRSIEVRRQASHDPSLRLPAASRLGMTTRGRRAESGKRNSSRKMRAMAERFLAAQVDALPFEAQGKQEQSGRKNRPAPLGMTVF